MAEVAASPAIARDLSDIRMQARNLFVVGFLVLFLELACIRWFAAYVVFLQFFTNVALLASFLGMSCGCMAARQERDWLSLFPFIALAAMDVETFYGKVKFGPAGQITSLEPPVFQLVGGKPVILWPAAIKQGELRLMSR